MYSTVVHTLLGPKMAYPSCLHGTQHFVLLENPAPAVRLSHRAAMELAK